MIYLLESICSKKTETAKYLGVVTSERNEVSEDIRTRLAAGNRYLVLKSILQNPNLSKKANITVYRAVLRLVVIWFRNLASLSCR